MKPLNNNASVLSLRIARMKVEAAEARDEQHNGESRTQQRASFPKGSTGSGAKVQEMLY